MMQNMPTLICKMESKAINHRSECLAFVPCLIRHFSLVCLLAVLFFTPKVSFATTVQGTTAYSSSSAAQTQINTLIAAIIAAHPEATQNGNTVRWDEGSNDARRTVTKAWTIRAVEIPPHVELRVQFSGPNAHISNLSPSALTCPVPFFTGTTVAEVHAQFFSWAAGSVSSCAYDSFNANGESFVRDAYVTSSGGTYAYTNQTYKNVSGAPSGIGMSRIGVAFNAGVTTVYYIDYQDTGSQLIISLSGGTSTEPGKSLPFTATVKNQDGSAPSEPVAVNISLKVDPTSGGHDHGDSTRPRGKLSGTACLSDATCLPITTNGNGVASFSFDAPDASGTHTITATCDKCSNSPKTAEVKVMVDGLETIGSSGFYALNEVDGKVIGAVKGMHTDNHYLTNEAAWVLWYLSGDYHFDPLFSQNGIAPPLLHLNDASLVWGGRYDIKGTWVGEHAEHRRGTVIDIRANSASGAISARNFNAFIKMAKRSYGADAKIHSPGAVNQHFHVRLLGKGE